MTTRKRSRSTWALAVVAMTILLTATSATWADVVLKVDFNSNQDSGGDSTTADDPGLSTANNHQEGWSSYHANHEVAAEFSTADYDGITVTPDWPNNTDNRTQQSIDRAVGNDDNWDDAEGYLNLVTDWIGIDTRTANGGNGDWDGTAGTPTYMTLTLGGLSGGSYEWTSFHHDTEHCHGPFAVWLSTDGGATFTQLDDGLMTDSTPAGTPDSGATESGPDVYTLSSTYHASIMANGTDGVVLRFAPYSDAAGVHRQIWGMNGFVLELASSDKAFAPAPADGATDVPRPLVLAWSPADGTAATDGHRVFLSDSFTDVNDGSADAELGIVSSPELDVAALQVALDYGMTYYWRVDQASTPGGPWTPGSVWNFTMEPPSYPIDMGTVSVTASSVTDGQDPINTVNGSGLNENDEHSNVQEDMWLGAETDLTPAITFELAQVEKLDKVHVWNHNTQTETILGFSIKEALIETSLDGENWTELKTVELPQATGNAAEMGSDVAVDGIVAKYVRITALSNYSVLGLPQKGLSEVRFYAVPMRARQESPVSGTAGLDPLLELSWRAGREAAQHEVLIGNAPDALVAVATVGDLAYMASLDLGSTVYWQVNEVNDATDPAVWEGQLWEMATVEYLTVDDMESYKSREGSFVWETWIDGFGDDTNGALLGHNGDDMETDTVYDGDQSLPYYYGQGGSANSEASRDIERDWGQHGIVSISLMFHGATSNIAGEMYLKVNGAEIATYSVPSDLTIPLWQAWTIDLPAAALGHVESLAIGVKGGTGLVLIDAIRLYARASETIDPAVPDDADLVGHWMFDESSGTSATDSSGNNNHGTVMGDAFWVADGKVGGALAFDGVDDIVVVNQASGLPIYNNGTDNAYSIAMWVMGGPQNDMRIFSESSSTSNNPLFNMGTHNSTSPTGQYAAYIRPDTGTTLNHPLSQANPFDDTWHHIAWVDDNGTAKLYVDGQLDSGDFNYTRGTMALDTTTIGGILRADPSHFFFGQIDEVRIYNRALSQGETLGLTGRTDPIFKAFD